MLKRIISPVLIAVICAFCCAPAVAETSESEILFRNIPWDSSLSRVQGLLKADLGEEITLKKKEPLYYMDRPELGCYSGYNSDEPDYYEVPGNGLHFQNVYVDEIHLFFRDDRLVQAGYYFRTDPNDVKQMFMRLLAGQEECLEFAPALFTAFVEKVVVSGTKKDHIHDLKTPLQSCILLPVNARLFE